MLRLSRRGRSPGPDRRKTMLKRVGLVLVLVASLLAAGCVTTGARGSAADEAAVRAVLQTYAESVSKGDVEMHAALWDEAAIKHKPNAPAIVGIQALRERWKGWALNTTRMVVTTQEVIVSGDWAFAHGVYTSESVPKAGGKTTYVDGKFLTVFKREADGTWKIYADTSSSNVP
jgi:ketosteroid isomerase-like protein